MLLIFLVMASGAAAYAVYSGTPLPLIDSGLAAVVIGMILLSYLQNYFEVRGLAAKDLSYREPFVGLQPILASSIAFLLFPGERELKYILGILAGAAILYIGNREKRTGFKLDKGTAYILLALLFDALVVNSYKFGLQGMPPEWLFLFRTAGVLLLTAVSSGVSIGKMEKKAVATGIAAGAFYLVGSLAYLYSIQSFGLTFTIMLLMVQPGLVYIASSVVLKEKIPLRRIVTSLLLVALVVAVIVA
ncbi:Uncharacterised protein [uncultured archaeon]|nr:Uncharacterised protein [uncultured archaeon]